MHKTALTAKMLASLAILFFVNPGARAVSDLVTVPGRESVQLTIYNSADITMVREQRRLTFKKGQNLLQFAWAGTLIDPTSLRLSFKTNKKSLDLLDTTFPPNRNDALQWNIRSDFNGSALAEITYFTSGITWAADYVILTNPAEDNMALSGNVRIVNNSGEDYPNASVRLMVGTINLVEKISDLARGYRHLPPAEREEVRREFKRSVERAGKGAVPSSPAGPKKKEIIKEGLSEYFLFSIEGTETIPDRWQKRLNFLEARDVPLQVIYRLSDKKTGGEVHKYYEFKNKKTEGRPKTSKLGESPLPDGRFQIFTAEPDKSLSFKGAVSAKYAARGDKIKLNVGLNQDVRVERTLWDYKRTNVNVSTNYYKQKYVKNYEEVYYYRTVIENALLRPVKLEVERSFAGEYTLKKMKFKWERVSRDTFRYYPDLPASSKRTFNYTISVFRGQR